MIPIAPLEEVAGFPAFQGGDDMGHIEAESPHVADGADGLPLSVAL